MKPLYVWPGKEFDALALEERLRISERRIKQFNAAFWFSLGVWLGVWADSIVQILLKGLAL